MIARILARYFTRYRIVDGPAAWASVGPVWANDGRLAGACVQVGPYGFAVHRAA